MRNERNIALFLKLYELILENNEENGIPIDNIDKILLKERIYNKSRDIILSEINELERIKELRDRT